MRNRRGNTLVEVLIASGLFLLALLLCGELAVMGMHSETSTTDKNQAFRWGEIALDQLNKDLAETTEIYQPSTMLNRVRNSPPRTISPTTAAPLILQSSSGELGPTVVGYELDSSGNLTRTQYEPSYDPASPGTLVVLSGQKPKVIATWVTNFSLYGTDTTTEYGAKMVMADIVVSTVAPGKPGPNILIQSLTRLKVL